MYNLIKLYNSTHIFIDLNILGFQRYFTIMLNFKFLLFQANSFHDLKNAQKTSKLCQILIILYIKKLFLVKILTI